MKILHIVDSVGKESYGLGSISMGLSKAQLELGEDVSIWTSDNDNDLEWASKIYDIPQEKLFGFPTNIPSIRLSTDELKMAFKNKFDIVHQHSLWTPQSMMTTILRKNGAKTCIAAHGTLSEFALKKSKFKKKIALAFFEKNNLKKSNVLHATSELEIEDFKRLHLKNPIAYIENGIGSQVLSKKGNGDAFRTKYNIPNDKKVLLYFSRITPKKGLDMLLPAIAELGESFKDWILVVVGNNEFNYQDEVQTIIQNLQIQHKVFIIEPQYGDAKFDTFDASDFFILPSYSEGSPMVVVDALAYGLPVITTKSSSWKNLEEYHCGFWSDISKDAIKENILKMVNLSDESLIHYSINAQNLIKNKYLWDEIAKKTVLLYRWILYKDVKPDFIY